MGCCCYPEPNPDGTHNCSNVSGPGGCPGGLYTEGPCPLVMQCFFLRQLGLYLSQQTGADTILGIAALPTFSVLFDFRDIILRKSAIGREVLSLYKAHAERAVEIMLEHPSQLRRALMALVRGAVFAQDALRAQCFSSADVATGAMKLDAKIVEDIRALIRDFTDVAPKKEFGHVLTRVSDILNHIEGKSTRDIVKYLAVEGNKKPSTSA